MMMPSTTTQPCQGAQKVKERDEKTLNDGCQMPKPITLVVLGRGPQGVVVQMQDCCFIQGTPVQVERYPGNGEESVESSL
jgi:hypothetical protein